MDFQNLFNSRRFNQHSHHYFFLNVNPLQRTLARLTPHTWIWTHLRDVWELVVLKFTKEQRIQTFTMTHATSDESYVATNHFCACGIVTKSASFYRKVNVIFLVHYMTCRCKTAVFLFPCFAALSCSARSHPFLCFTGKLSWSCIPTGVKR